MTAPPLVTVIIPTCNRLNYLQQAVQTVRAQTFRDWELIVVDDAGRIVQRADAH